MKDLKGTQTEQNLLKSFAGESQARSRYTMFASIAKKEGFEQIAAIFLETAEQELTHAKKFFRYLQGGMVEITAAYPADKRHCAPSHRHPFPQRGNAGLRRRGTCVHIHAADLYCGAYPVALRLEAGSGGSPENGIILK